MQQHRSGASNGFIHTFDERIVANCDCIQKATQILSENAILYRRRAATILGEKGKHGDQVTCPLVFSFDKTPGCRTDA